VLTERGDGARYQRRVGEPADVCRAVRFCIESDFVTGTGVVVDGGRLLRP